DRGRGRREARQEEEGNETVIDIIGVRLPILAKHGLYLSDWGSGNKRRFISHFRATWKRIPEYNQGVISSHWRRLQREHESWPNVELLSDWSRRDPKRGVVAYVGMEGREMRFLAPLFDRMPRAVAMSVIAHELAHVWQFGGGRMAELGGAWETERVEADADAMMEMDWGFDPYLLSGWYKADEKQCRPRKITKR